MRTYKIDTNYTNPKTGRSVWYTNAVSLAKALANVRSQIHHALAMPYYRIITTYWTEVA